MAAVSLLVGGIGIMNIMLVSVTERTREIGLRLAIGALEREVLLQFLIEAVVLAALGGLIGIVIATGASYAGAQLLGVPYLFDPAINLLSFVFSAGIGVLFGYFPGRRAARRGSTRSRRCATSEARRTSTTARCAAVCWARPSHSATVGVRAFVDSSADSHCRHCSPSSLSPSKGLS